METSQELTLKFMLALASNPSFARDFDSAFDIYTMAKALTHIYLEKAV